MNKDFETLVIESADLSDQVAALNKKLTSVNNKIAQQMVVAEKNDIVVDKRLTVSYKYSTPRKTLDLDKVAEDMGLDTLDDYLVTKKPKTPPKPSIKVRKVKVKGTHTNEN